MSRVLRRCALVAARAPFADAAVDVLERMDRGGRDAFNVLAYHRIGRPDRPSDLDPRLISATPERFEAQLAYLATQASPMSFQELLDVRRGRGRLRPRSVLLTFDDAYVDFAEYAWPLLRRYGVPAVLFVPTSYPDRPDSAFWWDRFHAAIEGTSRRRLDLPGVSLPLGSASERRSARVWAETQVHTLAHERAMGLVDDVEAALAAPPPRNAVLSWDELRALARDGLVVGAHTRTHPLLHRLAPAAVRDEILGSAADLERELGEAPVAFAYPGGYHSDAAVAAVREAGFELAFTVARGTNDVSDCDWYRLRRVHVGVRSPLAALRIQLLRRPRPAVAW